jgi:CRP/FNR family transcriptional regulator
MTRKARQPTTEEIKISCSNCSLAELCLPHGLTKTELEQLEKIVKRKPPLQPGQHLYRAGDTSFSLYAVRSGTLKSYYTTDDGDEQVLGFTLPGEMVGFDGLSDGHYTSNSVVLETSCVCSLPYERLEELCHTTPGLHKQIMRVVGREITLDHQMLLLLGKRNAEERLATFLVKALSRARPVCHRIQSAHVPPGHRQLPGARHRNGQPSVRPFPGTETAHGEPAPGGPA